jgi:hypothetical protein
MIFIGTAAAYSRIRRDERDQGRHTLAETWPVFQRRCALTWEAVKSFRLRDLEVRTWDPRQRVLFWLYRKYNDDEDEPKKVS